MVSQALDGCLPEGYGGLSVGARRMVGVPRHRRATTTARESSSASASLRTRFRRAGAVPISGVFGLHPCLQPGQPFLAVVEIVTGRLEAHEDQNVYSMPTIHVIVRGVSSAQ